MGVKLLKHYLGLHKATNTELALGIIAVVLIAFCASYLILLPIK